ncbi:hypothetical protein E2562_024041 [Oryza meyeriana var. granulata]|uniref:Uncharacterized protein n=1 Tax=Oryza meyeriana var. granulata TaxID=110450 RepID=A0A6G1CSF5_9ORYZ|nr:hypothetical protein E2562_024041 [Oryza meyeriana var. granulata]
MVTTTSPRWRQRWRAPLLQQRRDDGGRIADLRVVAEAGARARGDLAPCLASLDGTVRDLRRFRLYLDLHVLDHHDGRLLLKPRLYNMLYVYHMTVRQRLAFVEVRWPDGEVFKDHMVGFLLDGGDVVFVRKPTRDLLPVDLDHCRYYSAATKEWRVVKPRCRDADAARYRQCRYNIVCTERAGDVVYTLCSHCPAERCRSLVALDTRTMERSVVELPRYLRPPEVFDKNRSFTIMEMARDAGGIGLVAVHDRSLILRVWLWHGGSGDGEDDWTLHRKVMLRELARQITGQHQVYLVGTKVVAARRGVLHLRMETVSPPAVAVEQQTVTFFASLELESMSFSNVQEEEGVEEEGVVKPDKLFLYTVPWRWRPPFLPPDHEEHNNNAA